MNQDLLRLSQTRWRGDEPDAGLTWGVPMTGDAFVGFLRGRVELDAASTIVEIGPGYGRILDGILAAGLPFGRYVGLDLSAARVARLRERYRDPRIQFEQADVLGPLALNIQADLVVASAVFEHLYPDFGAALDRMARFTRPGAALVVDFIRDDGDADRSAAWFDRETYLRMYSAAEVAALLETSGFTLQELGRISFGRDILNREITRTIALGARSAAVDRSAAASPAAPPDDGGRFERMALRDPAPCDPTTLEPPVQPAFRSAFGGLWTDLTNADAIAAGKVALGVLSPDEAAVLECWRRDGFVILPGVVDAALADAVLDDFERACDGQLDLKMSYWDDAGRHVAPARRDRVQRAEAKLLDLHGVSAAAQDAIFAPAIRRFLDVIFERPPLAFQSLGFYYGSQQPLHQDTAFVRVSSPMEFVASWIALEDIQPGSGELEYYPGSHALPHHLFGGRHLWVHHGDPEVASFSERLHTLATAAAGLRLQRFRPRKGDALIWAAGLMHGGSPVTDARLSRKSLVTHYCPADLHPMYVFKGGRVKRRLASGGYVVAELWE
jgi:SAM-dependent methyltransferase